MSKGNDTKKWRFPWITEIAKIGGKYDAALVIALTVTAISVVSAIISFLVLIVAIVKLVK